MDAKKQENYAYLGDGLYVHYTGYSYDLSVNDHRNPPVASFEPEHIKNLTDFMRRKEDEK